jgi:photosystem II oxygen-evolving enhancer protein 2
MKFKSLVALCVIFVVLSLTACISPIAGLKAFVNTSEGYRFLYPNGWVQVQMTKSDGSPDVVFRDLINETENVSVVISTFASNDFAPNNELDRSLESLGSPGEVGYLLQQKAIAPPDSGRTAELVDAESRQVNNRTYYVLEYEVTLPNQKRHDIASVVVSGDKLYTFNASTTDDRWKRVQTKFKTIVESFSVR